MLNSNCLSPLDKQMRLCKRSLKNLETAPLSEISGISCFCLDHRLQTRQRRSFFLSFVLLIYFWPEPRFLGLGGTGSKSWWASSRNHCPPVVAAPDARASSLRLGTRGDAALRAQSRDASVSPWQTDSFFRRMKVPVLCECAGVIGTKQEAER